MYWGHYTKIIEEKYTKEEIEEGYKQLVKDGYIVLKRRSYALTDLGKSWVHENWPFKPFKKK
jgi:predicted transcriptional regulator